MMKSKSQVTYYTLIAVAFLVNLGVIGCSSDNHPPSAAELKATDDKRLQYVDKLDMPDAAKKELKSHMGGPPYANPAIAEAMAAAKAKGAKVAPGGRQF